MVRAMDQVRTEVGVEDCPDMVPLQCPSLWCWPSPPGKGCRQTSTIRCLSLSRCLSRCLWNLFGFLGFLDGFLGSSMLLSLLISLLLFLSLLVSLLPFLSLLLSLPLTFGWIFNLNCLGFQLCCSLPLTFGFIGPFLGWWLFPPSTFGFWWFRCTSTTAGIPLSPSTTLALPALPFALFTFLLFHVCLLLLLDAKLLSASYLNWGKVEWVQYMVQNSIYSNS